MKIHLLRHSTFLISIGGKQIIVDPMFMTSGIKSPIPTKKNGKGKSNPLVDLPVSEDELKNIINSLDAVLITHMHFDHFYETENITLPRDIPVLCQPADADRLNELGFKQVIPIDMNFAWKGITINRVKCSHGGLILKHIMGEGSGFVLKAKEEPSVYISGDTVWDSSVKKTLLEQKPEISILYAGGAKFPIGRSITMDKADIEKVCNCAPDTKIITVHMEAINHCLLTRKELGDYLNQKQLSSRVKILDDGELFTI
ncbi:MAG: MBL fold metallo-hydrolase [Bacillota bacterium]|nr:MBL fold metallo-hydrolase [Bacillota bacterium]